MTYLNLATLKLTSAIDSLVANLPSELQTLDVSNTVLAEFPVGVTKLKQLRSLCV